MKRFLCMLFALSLVVCLFFALPFNSSAISSATEDGLEVSITTDKDEYGANEDIQIHITVKNNNWHKVSGISIETLLPKGLELKGGDASLENISIAAGSFYTASVVAQYPEAILDNGNNDNDNEGTSGGSGGSNMSGNSNASSDDETNRRLTIILSIIGGIILIAVIALIIVLKPKKASEMMSLFLCLATLLSILPMGIFVQAMDLSMEVDKTILVKGEPYTISGKIEKEDATGEADPGYHTVIFTLNDGSDVIYESQMVPYGSFAKAPTNPERMDYTFNGWHLDSECTLPFDFTTPITQDTVLYASWSSPEDEDALFYGTSGGGTTFSISGIEMQESFVCVTINANSACTLYVEFLDENTDAVITSVSTQTPGYCELTPITVSVDTSLPEKYVIVGYLLDDYGDQLCNPFSCIKYTTAYELHSQQTVYDFYGDKVINFDESINKNYGVLCDDIIDVTVSDTVNKLYEYKEAISTLDDESDETEYNEYLIFENPDSVVSNLKVGDKIYIQSTQYLLKIASIETDEEGNVVILISKDVELSDFYKVLNVDMEIDVNEAQIEDTASEMVWDVIDAETSLTLQANIKYSPVPWLDMEGRFSGTGTVKVDVKYDLRLFRPDYFYISVVTELKINLDLDVKFVADNDDEVKEQSTRLTEIKLGKWTIPTGIPGLTVTAKPAALMEWEVSAGLTFEFNSKTTSGFSYCSDYGKQDIDKKERSVKVGLEGKVSLKIGPKVTLSVEFCKEVLKASLTCSAGIKMEGETELVFNDSVALIADSVHACSLCIEGEMGWYIEVNASLSYKIKGIIEGKIVDWDIVKLEGDFPQRTFYLSLINSSYSEFGGRIRFGRGECPNKAHRTEVIVKDSDGDELSNVDIVITDEAGRTVTSGKSKLTKYLHDGTYVVSCTVGGEEIRQDIEVNGSPQTITLQQQETGTLSGKICKASDRVTAVPGAKIEVYKDEVLYTTKYANNTGNYSINLAEGEYLVIISSEGFINFISHATVTVNVNTYMETFLMIQGEEGSTGVASGTVINSLTGEVASGVTLSVRERWNNNDENAETIATTITESNGYYSFELDIGNYTVMATKDGFTTSYFNIIVQPGTTSSQNGIITPVMAEGVGNQYLITLTWGENPRDLDSHLYGKPGNASNFHVYYRDQDEYIGGELICNLDYDDTSSYGPEHVTLTVDEDGVYYYYIHRYAGSGSLVTSEAQITVEQGNVLIARFNVPTDLDSYDYWNVFAIKDGRIIMNNTITDSPDTSYAD